VAEAKPRSGGEVWAKLRVRRLNKTPPPWPLRGLSLP